MDPLKVLVVLLAGSMAGAMNSVAGGGTLVSFPALVWLGRDPIMASATNAVALWPGSLASAFGFRRELRTGRAALEWLALPSLLGGLVGALLLLRTPSRMFAEIVPGLILAATLLFAFQDKVKSLFGPASHGEGASSRARLVAWVFQFAAAVYGGYFGAGLGILILAGLALLGRTDIHEMNGIKNLLAASINGVAAVYFAWSGAVNWVDAACLGLGAMAGGLAGAGLARRLGRAFVQRAVVVIGVVMAVSLGFKSW